MTGQEVYRLAFMDGLRPEPNLTVSQWADENRYLSQKASSEPGRWRTSRTPYLKEIMDNLSPSSPIQRVVFIAGAQIGKTETGNNWFGYVVHHAPGPMLMVQPTVELAKRLSKQRLAPMIEESPSLKERIAEARERDSGNTMLAKEFPGGVLVITGANSAVGLRSMPVRYLFMDEVDAWPSDLDGEGDPVKLAERRTTTFSRRKIYIVSTPTIKDASRIEREYEASDKRLYYVPCPHCENMDWIRWKNIRWDNDDPKTARLFCESCGCLIEEHHKTDMLLRGEWRATSASADGKTAGFHLSSLYSPLGWKSWVEIVGEFLAAKSDPPRLKEFVNTVLAETWEESFSAKIGAEALAERAEEYALLTVPQGGLILTAGVDVQDNRLAVKVKAWGKDEESWLVNWMEIYGDPADLTERGPWAQVDSVLAQEYEHASGAKMKVRATAVDTGGHFTHEAYVYCRNRKQKNVFAVKGSSTPGKAAIGKPSRQDVNFKNQTIKGGVDLWLIGVDTIKATIYGRLKLGKEEGGGAYHFPLGLSDEYYKQLTAEKQITRYVNGHPKRIWIKKDGARNEALDCFDDKTEVLTASGWKFWPQVNEKDQLATVNKTTDMIEYQHPICLISKPYKGEMVSFRSSRLDVLVTPNHRMWAHRVRSIEGKKTWKQDTDLIPATDVKSFMALKTTAKWSGNIDPIRFPAFISAQGIEVTPERSVDRHDVAALVGWYLSEGHSYRGNINCSNPYQRKIVISQYKQQGLQILENLVARLPFSFRRTKIGYECTEAQLFEYLDPLKEYCYDMYIPDWIRDSAPSVIDAFLEAYIAGDGWSDNFGHRTIATTCKRTADIIQELFLKVGRNARIKTKQPQKNTGSIRGREVKGNRVQFHISEIRTARAYLYGSGMKSCIAREEYDGMVYCATVPNDTLVVRRNGKIVITGNCEVYSYAALQYFYTRTNRNNIWLNAEKILDKLKPSDETDHKASKENHGEDPRTPMPPRSSNPHLSRRRPGFKVKGW